MSRASESQSPIRRWMYGAPLHEFLRADSHLVLGSLLKSSEGDVEVTQRNAWDSQVQILKSLDLPQEVTAQAQIYFELRVPRLGRRADVVLLIGAVMFIVEFKVGASSFDRSAINQVWDYALDFKYFHETSHHINILPVLVATEASDQDLVLQQPIQNDGLFAPAIASPSQLSA